LAAGRRWRRPADDAAIYTQAAAAPPAAVETAAVGTQPALELAVAQRRGGGSNEPGQLRPLLLQGATKQRLIHDNHFTGGTERGRVEPDGTRRAAATGRHASPPTLVHEHRRAVAKLVKAAVVGDLDNFLQDERQRGREEALGCDASSVANTLSDKKALCLAELTRERLTMHRMDPLGVLDDQACSFAHVWSIGGRGTGCARERQRKRQREIERERQRETERGRIKERQRYRQAQTQTTCRPISLWSEWKNDELRETICTR